MNDTNQSVHGFKQPFEFEVPHSKVLACAALMMAVLAILVLFWINLLWIYKWLLLLFLGFYILFEGRRYLRQPRTQIKRDMNGLWMLREPPSNWLSAKLMSRHYLSPHLIVLHIETVERKCSFWLFRYQLGADTFRQLTVYLRLQKTDSD